MSEVCGYVIARAEEGPCETCGHRPAVHGRATWDGKEVCHDCGIFDDYKHPYLGPPEVCGHPHGWHRIVTDSLGRNPVDFCAECQHGHNFVPATRCETCGGRGLMFNVQDGVDAPCPDCGQ